MVELKEPFRIMQPEQQKHSLYDGLTRMFMQNFAAVTLEPITYNGETVAPKPLVVRRRIFCDFSCPSHCGACCVRANLEYLPFEWYPKEAEAVVIKLNGKEFLTYQDRQDDNKTRWCRNLSMESGRCGVYPDKNFPGKVEYPFSCDFNLMQVHNMHTKDGREGWALTTALFGRPWHLQKIDGTKGAMCEMLTVTQGSILGTRRRLARLYQWTNYFGLETRMGEIVDWAMQDPNDIKEDLWMGL